jgi:hypothetical protein
LAENASYSFTGYRNYSIAPQNLLFTGPQCFAASLTTAKYNGILLEFDPDEENGSRVNLTVGGPPTVSARFDGKSASLEIKGMLSSSSKKEGANDVVYLGGPITISFLGSIDDSRSDELLSNSLNGTPIWNETLGYSKLLSGEEVKKEGIGSRTEIGMWTLMISACVAFMFGF